MAEFVVIVGMSGAGRSTAAAVLEDLGYFVIDNLPASLIPKVAELVELGNAGSSTNRPIALVLGRGGEEGIEKIDEVLAELKSSHRVTVLFLDAPDDVLVKRFESTRRRHPFNRDNLLEGIAAERRRLFALKSTADVVIDTGSANVHQLRARLTELFSRPVEAKLSVTVISFAFSKGIPLDVDLLFDVRFLPNPHWVPELRPLSGTDEKVRDYVLSFETTKLFLERLRALFEVTIPGYVQEGKSYLTIGIGCTGGRHRSVVLAEEIASLIEEFPSAKVRVIHRDLE